MTFKLATAFVRLDAKRAPTVFDTVGKVTEKIQSMAKTISTMTGGIRGGIHPLRAGHSLTGLPALHGTRPGWRTGKAAMQQPFQFTSLAGLAEKMQQEAATQDADRRQLIAQQEANEHLGALAGAAGGPGLRVQVVGAQPAQW